MKTTSSSRRPSSRAANAPGEPLLAWQSRGFSYGIERRVLDWLETGDDVVVNGSRSHLETAITVLPELRPVWIAVAENLLYARLDARGRETAAQIGARMRRNRELEVCYRSRYTSICNHGSIAHVRASFEALRRREC